MKTRTIVRAGIIPAALLIAACGDDVTKVTKIEGTSGMEVVASADSLGKCTEEISGEMKFATKENAVYVCADSAWKNVSKTEKASCSAETLADSSGFKIVCDGDSIGVVRNGTDGKDGEKGEAGKDGASGESCKLAEGPVLDAGSSQIRTSFVICGKDTVTLSDGRTGEGCDISDGGDGTISVVCGDASTTLYKAFCGGTFFNPDSNFCFADSIVSLCGGNAFDLNTSFCLDDVVIENSKLLDKKAVWNLMNPEIEYGMFVDKRDSQVYRSVKIGEQTWMAENLNYAYNQKTSGLDSSSFCYNNEPDSCAKYGRFYLWSAAVDSVALFGDAGKGCGYKIECASTGSATMVRGVCPEGWHLPDSSEFATYTNIDTAKGIAAEKLKSKSEWDWNYQGDKTGNGTDDFGFSALPAGEYTPPFSIPAGKYAFFWEAANYNKSSAFSLMLTYDELLEISIIAKNHGLSVRCVRDE